MGDSASENSQNKIAEEVSRVVELSKELQDSASSLITKASNEEQALRQRVAVLDSNIQKLRSSIDSAVEKSSLDRKEAEKLDEELYKAKCILTDGDASSYLPSKSNGSFLKMFLGPINVRANRKDIQLKVKEEYNSYRDRTAFLFLLFPSALLFLGSKLWNGCLPALPVQLYQAWLLFLYTSLALRENILRANGSDIRPWWIYHHYCAMVMALISLTWEIKGQPDCANKQARRMDVVWGETAGVEGQLLLLCPLLFILQGFEAYVGLLLLRTVRDGVVSEWQVVVCGILLVVMAVGNFTNTVETLMAKSRVKAKMRTKSKLELDQARLR
ncbi:transmembrane protein 120 homolog isoform X2 [Telopea speciosissima]|uniref:transmembrane protein 120 homolog isoform X2 n=1 Tax=Telopea speciosissima TaxID=54955 RepID=UPI001CC8224F|nr:transmembrane protein 120 homolog isoform X2 [Telopea speciosissima]